MEMKILDLEMRISKLEGRADRENAKIVAKLRRRVRSMKKTLASVG